MFRAAAVGPYDEAINKATDENLTSEDWGAIMEVVDRVERDPNGSKEAVQSMIKRLAHRNANVQLYTLEVANALSQNCGKPMHRELSSRAFTESLLKLANDRNTHQQVKAKILERMKDWTDMFKSDPDLGIMYDAYYRLKQSNPTLHPPSAPQKNSLTQLDRQKEEEELQMALKLSLQEEERKKHVPAATTSAPAAASSSGGAAGAQAAVAQQQHPVPSGTTAATVSRVRALFDFVPSEPGELEFKKGDVIAVLESVYKDWWRGSLKGKTGIFPLNYVEKLTDPTPDELQREAQMEAEVFAEIKNVEKLLTLLSASNTGPREEDNEEISKLYHQTLAIRPKLIKLIEKYSQKKDDFTQLNEKFIKARRDYEALLESSMSHPPGPSYHQYAMRPQIPQTYAPPGPGYGAPPPQQDPQRFYTPAPGQEPSQYPPLSPSPNFQRPPIANVASPAPAPFFLAGAEVPAQPPNQPPVAPPQQQPPPQQNQQQQSQQRPPPQNQYPPQRPQEQRIPSGGPKQPAPIQTSPPPPVSGQYAAYQANPPQAGGVRPQSTYGAPQELSTSVYDSPIASHNAAVNSAATYTSSHYSTDDPYAAAAQSPVGGPGGRTPSIPSAPTPDHHNRNQRQSSYGQYSVYQTQAQQPSQPSPYGGAGYGDGPSENNTTNNNNIPPAPSGQAPPPPVPGSNQRPSQPLSPPPLQPSGPAYDARQTLPSRLGGASSPSAPSTGPGQPSQPQYKAYVPPGSNNNSGAPGGPSGPGGYGGMGYVGRQQYQAPHQGQQQGYPGGPGGGGPGAGGQQEDNGPSAPADYYRTAAY